MRRHQLVVLVLVAGSALMAPAAASPADIVSTFDLDADGWRVTQDGQSFEPAPWSSPGHITFNDAGEDPSGSPGAGFFRGGTAWTGDLSGHYGGTLTFALRHHDPIDCTYVCPPISVRIVSPNGTVEKSFGEERFPNDWITYSVPLVGGDPNGLVYPDSSGSPPTPAHLANILSDVTGVDVQAEVSIYRTQGPLDLDNVSIAGSAPPPDSHTVARALSLAFARASGGFVGRLDALGHQACSAGQKVQVFRKRRGPDVKVGAARTDASADYLVSSRRSPGRYYARVKQTRPPFLRCSAAVSETLRLR